MEMHHRDRYYLGSFGADLEDKELLKEYATYRKVWAKSENVGELPVPTNLALAVKYPKKVIVKRPYKKQQVALETS